MLVNFEDRVKDLYNEKHSKKYRNGEKLAVQYGSRKHYCDVLWEISGSFDNKISVLDVGCGTGRYFHCLKNVKRLLGVDISPHMLKQAHDPVKKAQMDVENIELLCGNIFDVNISAKFDFIYSIGVLGEYSPFGLTLYNRLFQMLKPKGKLFFTIVDTHSRIQHFGDELPKLKTRILRKAFPSLPSKIKKYVNKKLSCFYMTKQQIEEILKETAFARYEIERYEHPTGSGWQGAHYDCFAFKE